MMRALKTMIPALLGVLALAPCFAGDAIRPQNTSTTEIGALVDGNKQNSAVNDEGYVSLDLGSFFNALFPIIPLDNFVDASGANEIIGFARRRPPVLLEDIPWTAVNDTVDLVFEDEYRIPVHVWIVQGPFEGPGSVAAVAANGNVSTSMIWADERQGIAFSSFEIFDRTTDDDAAQFLDFSCGADQLDIKALIGHTPGVLNIYYVNRVDFGTGPSTTHGVWCSGGEIIAMGRNTSGPLLCHEIGHAFSLAHTNGEPENFDNTNVMDHSSPVRQYLTEGQTFRAVFSGVSSINRIYDVRAGEVIRSCSHYAVTDTCPAIYKRVWDDGPAWPPN
jgi:hypothetical protein